MAKGKYEYWLTDYGLVLLQGWACDGLTDKDIAKNIGITAKTLYEWKNKYSDICEALKKGKEVADYAVENALFKSAISGNITAQIFWLRNRRGNKWRNNPIEARKADQREDDNLWNAVAEAVGKNGI